MSTPKWQGQVTCIYINLYIYVWTRSRFISGWLVVCMCWPYNYPVSYYSRQWRTSVEQVMIDLGVDMGIYDFLHWHTGSDPCMYVLAHVYVRVCVYIYIVNFCNRLGDMVVYMFCDVIYAGGGWETMSETACVRLQLRHGSMSDWVWGHVREHLLGVARSSPSLRRIILE